MFLPRLIPVLLLKGKGLVKTVKFKDPKYIGDPINAVRIFNDLQADELIFLDIDATKENRSMALDLVKDISDEAYMPFAIGGGVSSLKQIEGILTNGSEKVVINSGRGENPRLIQEAAIAYGSQSVIVSIDYKKNFFGKYSVYVNNGRQSINIPPYEAAKIAESEGAGEILLHSIELDGTMQGYDVKLISEISEAVTIPVICCGGAGKLEHFRKAFSAGAHSMAAGSYFVYHGARKAVLINYPSKNEVAHLFSKEEI